MVVILDMSRNDLLVKIKQAEQTAESSLEGAEKERSVALRNAETKSHSVIDDARNKAETKASKDLDKAKKDICLLYTSPSPRDGLLSRMPSSA